MCSLTHRNCTLSSDRASKPPKRLLHIKPKPSTNVRLIDGVDQRESFKYACLSYCWGTGPKNHVLTTHNIRRYQHSINVLGLPLVLQHAIDFTRRLELEYLWIDAMCIIQDNDLDWMAQAAQMCDIYSNSYVTISGLGSASAEDGLYKQSPEKRLEVHLAPMATVKVALSPLRGHPSHQWYARSAEARQTWPLLTRAWCYQERILSPRIIHFGREELLWECHSTEDCECGKRGQSKVMIGSHPKKKHYAALHETAVESLNLPVAPDSSAFMKTVGTVHGQGVRLQQRWRDLVREYTRLSLSVEKDRLPAVKGLADSMSTHRQARYLHGLWEDCLLHDIVWRVRHPDVTTLEYQNRGSAIPSWSWAAVSAPVVYPEFVGTDPTFAEVLSMSPTLRILKLKGTAYPCQICRTWVRGVENEPYSVSLSLQPDSLIAESGVTSDGTWRRKLFADHALFSANSKLQFRPGRYCILHLATSQAWNVLFFLVLEYPNRSRTRSDSLWEVFRIGIMEIEAWAWDRVEPHFQHREVGWQAWLK